MRRAIATLVLTTTVFLPYYSFAGSPEAPEYKGGADGGGRTNGGTINAGFGVGGFEPPIAVSGNFAYLLSAGSSTPCTSSAAAGNGCELKVFDISNPAAPTYVGGGDATGSTNTGVGAVAANGITISGNYAYTAWDGNATICSATPGSAIGCEIKVWDISTPSAPTYVGGGDAGGSTNTDTDNATLRGITSAGDYIYTTQDNSATVCTQTVGSAIGCEMKAWDISTPGSPTYVGGGDASGSTNSGAGDNLMRTVVISGNYAYTTWDGIATDCSATPGSAIGCEFKVWDISTPATPTYVGGGDASGSTNTGTGNLLVLGITIKDNYAYTTWNASATECSQTVGSAIGCELKVWDISTPSTPTYVGGGDASGSTNTGTGSLITRSVAISGHYAYTTWGGNATGCSQAAGSAIGCELKVWDISIPSTPTYVGGGDASGSTNTGTGNSGHVGLAVQGNYVYTVWNGSATLCSAAPGAAIGCEFKIWDVGVPSVLLLSGQLILRSGQLLIR
jgi:hypothetical protein